MEHEHEPAVIAAPAAPAGAGVQALRGSPRLLAAGNAAIARAIAARAAIGRQADAGAPPPPESAPGGAPVPAADPDAAQEALRLNGLSMPDLLQQLTGRGRQWVDLNREALVHTPGVGPQRMALAVEAVLAGPTAPDERLATMMGEMQAMGLPEDQQEAVALYCGAFGLRAPSIMNRFIEGAKGLQQEWPALDPETRARRIAELAIASLDRAGVPAPKGIDVKEIPEGGLWLKEPWRIVVAARIGSRNADAEGLGRAAATIYHEARHAEQDYTILRCLAGQKKGPEAIKANYDAPMDIVQRAVGDPILPGDARAAKADEWLKSSTTSPLPPGDHARAEERDAHGTGDSVLDRLRDAPPDRSSRLTDPWVPTVGQQVVARWAMYGFTTMSKEELISQGVGGSTVAISHLTLPDLSGVEVKDRLKMAQNITGNIYVGPLDARSLERIWTSFGGDFSKIASANLALWHTCCVRHSGLVENVKPAKDIYDAVRSDTLALAHGYLQKNGEFVEEEMKAFGISEGEGKENAPATAGQTAAVTALQNAAHGLQALQFAQEAARETWVGIGLSPDQTLALKGDENNKTFVFAPVAYRPGEKPATTIPEGYFRDAKVVIGVPAAAGKEPTAPVPINGNADIPKLVPLKDFADLDAKYAAAEARVEDTLIAYPSLFGVMGDTSKETGAFADSSSPEAARTAMGTGFKKLKKNIETSKTDLGGKLDPLDLTPIHHALTAGVAKGDSKVAWNQPLPKAILEDRIQNHNIDIALRQLLVAKVSEIAFLLAPFTGGASLAVMAAGVATAGANFAIDERRYEALSAASKTQATPGTALVKNSDVDSAHAAAEAEGIALALAAATAGAAAVSAVMKGMKEAWRQKLLARVGQPSEVLTGGPSDPFGPRPYEAPYLEPPNMEVAGPGKPLNVANMDPKQKYLWVIDADGNFRVAPEQQGNYYAWRTRRVMAAKPGEVVENQKSVLKHGDLVPGGERGEIRGPARAGGEFVAEKGPDGQFTGRWRMNNDSGYTFFRSDAAKMTGANLDAAKELLGSTGTNTQNIITHNTMGADVPPAR